MRVGPWQVAPITSSTFALDGGAMFGIVPRPQWSRAFPPDDEGRVRLVARCLLLRHDDGPVVLIDVGMGGRWLGRARATYALETPDGPEGMLGVLAKFGVAPSDITDIVATHLHFDHVGGLVATGADRKLEATFPRAKVHVQAEHLAWARSPSIRDRASFRAADFQPIVEAGLLVEHEGAGEILPDLEVRLSWGHTPAMQMPLIRPARGEGSPLFFPSDLIPTSAHIQLPWVMAYDNRPILTVEEKAALFDEAVAEGWVLVFDHDSKVIASRLQRKGARIEAQQLEI